MKKKIIITGIIIAVIHFLLMFFLAFIALDVLVRFDEPGYRPSEIVLLAGWIANILMQPGLYIANTWMSKDMPNYVEWRVL